MAKLGDRVLYAVHDGHKTETVKGDKKLAGSVHHPELTEFAGLVGRLHADGSCDIAILVPNGELKWVDGVTEGTGAHQFTVLE